MNILSSLSSSTGTMDFFSKKKKNSHRLECRCTVTVFSIQYAQWVGDANLPMHYVKKNNFHVYYVARHCHTLLPVSMKHVGNYDAAKNRTHLIPVKKRTTTQLPTNYPTFGNEDDANLPSPSPPPGH